MPIIDFREIPVANSGDGNQDTFEMFARDFLQVIGFEIEEGPSRGADGGKDILAVEKLSGTLSSEKRKWLVSCKHKAHSGESVRENDEVNIVDRVLKFNAQGFIAFYSTIPSTGLMQTLVSLKSRINIEVFDKERIETILIADRLLLNVFKRYFTQSYERWQNDTRPPIPIWDNYTPLSCQVCGKDLLPGRSGIVAEAFRTEEKSILDVYWSCYGACDTKLEQAAWNRWQAVTMWESIQDLSIPLMYIRWVTGHMIDIREGKVTYTDEAFENLKLFTICMAQIVVKETSDEQRERLRDLLSIPEYLGGLGRG